MPITKKYFVFKVIILFTTVFFISSCKSKENAGKTGDKKGKKIGVLLVNHGSRSEAWRNGLLELKKM